MKKMFTLLGVVAAMTISAQTNLVQNPGFETGSLDSWAQGPTTSYTAPTISSSGPHSGNQFATYTGVTATTGFYQEMPVTAGATYNLSFWYKATGDGTDARIWSLFKDAGGTLIYYAGTSSDASSDPLRNNNLYLAPASDWTQFTLSFVAPADATTFQLAVRAYNNATVASFDDFSVTGSLSVQDFSKDKYSLVKNTAVTESITFAKDANIQIVNTAGQIVKTANVTTGSVLNVSNLTKGIYIVTGFVNGERVSQKIVKQ